MIKLQQASDERLVALYVEGNEEAFDVLIDRHKDRLYSYIYNIVKNDDRANDIFQDTFVKVIITVKQGRYVENGKFFSWMVRIAHNLIVDSFRQERIEQFQLTDSYDYDVFNRKDLSEDTIEDILVAQQIHADVRRLILELPPTQREVLMLRYYANMSFKEIADRTKVSINTALGRMRYAIMNIRRIAEERKIALSI